MTTEATPSTPGRRLAPLPRGYELGPWVLGDLIGAGGAGAVYKATDDRGRTAAVKVLLDVGGPNSRVRFMREAKAMGQVRHPSIIACLGSDHESEHPWIALELVDGEDLWSRLDRERKLDLKSAAPILLEVLNGLAAAHRAGVVHRDLKPANVLLASDGAVKLADFGLAKRDDESLAVTTSGQLLGTPYFMSPEQVRGGEADARSDIYSFGAIAFTVFSGGPPFDGSLANVLESHLNQQPPDLASLAPDLPRRIVDLITQCMSKDPESRPVIGSLQAAFAAQQQAAKQRKTGPQRKSGRQRKTGARPRPSGRQRRQPPKRPPALEHEPLLSLRSRTNPYLPAETQLPEVASAPQLPEAKPAPSPEHSRLLDGIAAVLLLIALLRCVDLGLGGRVLHDNAVLGWVRGVLSMPVFFGLLITAGLLAMERFMARGSEGAGVLDGFWLRRKAGLHAARGEIVSAALLYEQLGEREYAGSLLLEGERYPEAARTFRDAGLHERTGEALERAGKSDEALDVYRAIGSMESAFRVALESKTPAAAAYLMRYGQVDAAIEIFKRARQAYVAADLLEREERLEEALELLEVTRREGHDEDYWRHLGRQGTVADARRELGLRLGWLALKTGDAALAARTMEEIEEWQEAVALYRKAGDAEGEVRCVLEVLGTTGNLSDDERALAEHYAEKLSAEENELAGRFFVLLEDPERAARYYDDLGKSYEALDLYAELELFEEAARCAYAVEDHESAAKYHTMSGNHEAAGSIFEELGLLDQALDAYESAGHVEGVARVASLGGDTLKSAELLRSIGQSDQAMNLLSQVGEASAEHYDASLILADMHAERGDHQKALELYDALDLGTEFEQEAQPQLKRVACLKALGRVEEALQGLKRLVGTPLAPSDLAVRIADLEAGIEKIASPDGAPLRAVGGPHELVGTTVDRYAVSDLLGEGTFAWVYRAKHTSLERTCALKVLKPTLSSGEAPRRFLREGRALAGLEHPNLIAVYDAGEFQGLSYLALELIDGPTLREWAKDHAPLPTERAVAMVLQILSGLEAAHGKGIVHRDLKPTNVLVAPGDVAKLLDFGLARIIDDAHTIQRDFLGTPRYASPEQAGGDAVTAASDQYAAGLIAYELLSGRLPFESSTTMGWLTKHLSAAPLALGELIELPEGLEAVVMRALAKDAKERFADVGAFRAALEAFA